MAEGITTGLTLKEVNVKIENAAKPPARIYYIVLSLLALGILGLLVSWIYQVRTGMGVAGISIPVGWGVYIVNFVFWVGIAHSGTLISAILYLGRAKWRDAVSRSAEAMTVFAVMIAGLFPLVHLGRLWVFYYILPYPFQRQLWPNFKSALVWDVLAVLTYFTVSLIFFIIGMIPDMAVFRDRFKEKYGEKDPRARLFKFLALGWVGSIEQWRHYNRGYLFFAALATPLVISVHSIVSWDFATGILPGWHSTIFAPYFVAGAIHSGLAMVLIIMIPMRKYFSLESIITSYHLEMVAKTIIVTTLIVGYAYLVEPFIASYSNNIFEQQFAGWSRTGWIAWSYWILIPLNVLIPLSLIFKKVRKNLKALFIIAIFIIVGMYFERFYIIIGGTAHGFLPHTWGTYAPSVVELAITLGSFSLFFFLFLIFSKILPVVPVVDFKSQLAENSITFREKCKTKAILKDIRKGRPVYKAIFSGPDSLLKAAKILCDRGFDRMEIFSPVKIEELGEILGLPKSPIRFWVLGGAMAGFLLGLTLTIYTSGLYEFIVGGKTPVAMIPYWIIAFELTILIGSFANLSGVIFHSGLFRTEPKPGYESRFSVDKFGIIVEYDKEQLGMLQNQMKELGPDEEKFEQG